MKNRLAENENRLAQIDFMGCGGCPMMFFKGLLLIHFEKVRCTARAEVLYLFEVLFIFTSDGI